MIDDLDAARPASLSGLGWSRFFQDQVEPEEADLLPSRIATVHRTRLTALNEFGAVALTLPVQTPTGDFAVGDWVLAEPVTHRFRRRLARKTLLERRLGGNRPPVPASANVDTLFIVTSCNADFNPARLERYLALANQAGTDPVILLTKADTVPDVSPYRDRASGLQRGLAVVAVDARSADASRALAPWCGAGQTVALAGSSGVGKSTLVNTLAGASQLTGAVREHDAKGRHTTTSRSLHAIAAGGWVIDTPGMRTLRVGDAAEGIDALFAEITELAPLCRFRDCTHAHEPGCAVQSAVARGVLGPQRVTRWRKLRDETRQGAPNQTVPRGSRAGAARRMWR